MINDTVPVNSADIGFAKVREHTEGNFALIHDAARIKYEVYNDCDLVEIGEAFADQPYALAVQQGSHLQVKFNKIFFIIIVLVKCSLFMPEFIQSLSNLLFCFLEQKVN